MGQFASLSHYLPFKQAIRLAGKRVQTVMVAKLLHAVSHATTSRQLNRAVNKIQERLWSIHTSQSTERLRIADQLIDVLSTQMLFAPSPDVRMTAASLLRMLIQMGLSSQPGNTFATFVTAIVRASKLAKPNEQERYTYLTLLFECFWPFRDPHPAFSRQQFPSNAIFYPLAPLLNTLTHEEQEMLLAIFSELPRLDESEFTDYLLPFALQWSQHSDSQCRRSVCGILARMAHEQSREALRRLTRDSEATVRARACNAIQHFL